MCNSLHFSDRKYERVKLISFVFPYMYLELVGGDTEETNQHGRGFGTYDRTYILPLNLAVCKYMLFSLYSDTVRTYIRSYYIVFVLKTSSLI